jgi:hypothetical protein
VKPLKFVIIAFFSLQDDTSIPKNNTTDNDLLYIMLRTNDRNI